jgi:uracil-DNA glycosylase
VGARTQVVFGGGDADAELMLIGEAPGAREDEEGVPFVGASGKLLDELLASAGLTRADVFVTNALKCRPPGNRDPSPAELERCRSYLDEQIALVQPKIIATLGNFATRLLRGDSAGITELHGRAEPRLIAGQPVHLLPLYHPAAALYTRSLLDTLREDFARLPVLLAAPAPVIEAPASAPDAERATPDFVEQAATPEGEDVDADVATAANDALPTPAASPAETSDEPPQLGLF